ncbi:MAG: cytochrome c oxidase accessory protein CcoG [Myxococcota bacterium]
MSLLGADRGWIYAAKVKGRFQRFHRGISAVLFAILLITPWVPINGRPALLIDLWARRLYIFGGIFTPRDTIFLVLIGLFAAFALFFFTSLYGRLWCGYACPQTVFLEELIRPLEERIEGSRGKRMARDRGGWTFDRIWRKAVKWSAFAAIAGGLAMAMGSLFVRPTLLWTGQGPLGAYAVVGVVGAGLFFDFAWFREQFCNYLCPYARFQGALTDEESLVVSYQSLRGEPRGKKRLQSARKAAGEDTGECIDCKKCVAVCPQGIDIREGFQLECINCARCIDACAQVMGRLGQESLVRYTTIAEQEGRKPRILRGRTVAYGALLVGIAAMFFALLLNHTSIDATVNRAPGTLFTVDDDGYIRNTFWLQIENNAGEAADGPVAFTVRLEGLDDAELIVPPIAVTAGEARKVPLVVRVPADQLTERTTPMTVIVASPAETVDVQTTFKGNARLEG